MADLDRVLNDIRLLVELESPSGDSEGLRRCAQQLAGIIERELGTPAEIEPSGQLRWRHDGIGRPVLLLGHLDTVWPRGTLGRMPLRLEGERFHGPGVFDMKAGLVVAVHALAELLRQQACPPVELLVTVDEEVGSTASRPLIEELARRCRRVLVFEPCGPDGAVKVARKGVAVGRVVVHGRAAHAGLAPWDGINAVVALAPLIEQVAALTDPERGTTVTPTLLRGGTTINTVPARAELEFDVRFLDPAEPSRIEAALAQLEAPPAEVEAELVVNRPPLPRSASAPLIDALIDAAVEVGQRITTVEVGGASDGNLAAAAGAWVLDGLGPPGEGAHADHEHVLVDGLLPRIELVAALLPKVAAVDA